MTTSSFVTNEEVPADESGNLLLDSREWAPASPDDLPASLRGLDIDQLLSDLERSWSGA